MRWKEKRYTLPKDGDQLQESWFAILPVCVGYDWRWLEHVTIQYRYHIVSSYDGIESWWEKEAFINAPPRHRNLD